MSNTYTQEDFIRDIEADFRNARENGAQKKKLRELMERYGDSREEIEAKSSMGEWMEFVLANGDVLLDEVRREKLAEEAQAKNHYKMETLSDAAKTAKEGDAAKEASSLKDKTAKPSAQDKSSVINESKKAAEEDGLGVTQTPQVQLGRKNNPKYNNYQLGTLSERYESLGNPAVIGEDNAGGYSYGKYQIATKTGTMGKYINYLARKPEYEQFAMKLDKAGGDCAAGKKTESFEKTWIDLSKNQSFNKSQLQFIIETHLNPVLKKIKEKEILDIDHRHLVVKDVLYSMSVQHYGAPKIINKALDVLKHKQQLDGKNIDDAVLIKELYKQRFLYVKSLPESQYKGDGKITKKEKDVILKSRYPAEMKDALEYLE